MALEREQVLAVLREVVAPLIRADGGELYLVAAEADRLALHLGGRFSGCPGNTLVRRRVIEPAFAARFPELKIDVSSGPFVPKGAERVGG